MIDLPIAGGALQVAGLTTDEIQKLIVDELKRRAVEDGAHVSVGVRQYSSHTVIITGLVNNLGKKILRREAVPLYVVLAESQPRVDAARAVIMRGGVAPKVIDLSDSTALSTLIKPGDVINITSKPAEFYYIAGRVNYPGQKTYQSGITLLQAILAAGGIARGGDANVVELSREGAGGLLTTIKVSLKEIKAGKLQDPKLSPGDRIEVVD
jgi:protein involved in polysaccharide export with SLBB domain